MSNSKNSKTVYDGYKKIFDKFVEMCKSEILFEDLRDKLTAFVEVNDKNEILYYLNEYKVREGLLDTSENGFWSVYNVLLGVLLGYVVPKTFVAVLIAIFGESAKYWSALVGLLLASCAILGAIYYLKKGKGKDKSDKASYIVHIERQIKLIIDEKRSK